MAYRTDEINKGLVRIYDDNDLIGQARLGLDKSWYPELLPPRSRGAAIHLVVLAHEALREFQEIV